MAYAQERDPVRDVVILGLAGGGAWLLWTYFSGVRSASTFLAPPIDLGVDPGSADQSADQVDLIPPATAAVPASAIGSQAPDPIANFFDDILQSLQSVISPPASSAGASAALDAIAAAAASAGVDPNVFEAVLYTESRFNPTAVAYPPNGTVSYGIAQLNSATFPGAMSMSVSAQLNAAAQYLASLIASKGLAAGVAAYNGSGPAAQTYSQQVLATAGQLAAGTLPFSSAVQRNLAAAAATL